MEYLVKAYINDGPGRFFGYEPGDLLTPGPMLKVEADTTNDALNKAWEVGNRMGTDAEGEPWPSTVRSLSVADVLAVRSVGGSTPRAFAVATIGFEPVVNFALAVSLSEFAKVSDRGFDPDNTRALKDEAYEAWMTA